MSGGGPGYGLRTTVGFLDPAALVSVSGNGALRDVAVEAGERLARVRARLAG